MVFEQQDRPSLSAHVSTGARLVDDVLCKEAGWPLASANATGKCPDGALHLRAAVALEVITEVLWQVFDVFLRCGAARCARVHACAVPSATRSTGRGRLCASRGRGRTTCPAGAACVAESSHGSARVADDVQTRGTKLNGLQAANPAASTRTVLTVYRYTKRLALSRESLRCTYSWSQRCLQCCASHLARIWPRSPQPRHRSCSAAVYASASQHPPNSGDVRDRLLLPREQGARALFLCAGARPWSNVATVLVLDHPHLRWPLCQAATVNRLSNQQAASCLSSCVRCSSGLPHMQQATHSTGTRITTRALHHRP